jgi:hypothetical protein
MRRQRGYTYFIRMNGSKKERKEERNAVYNDVGKKER